MVLQKQTLQLPHLRRMSLNYFVLRNTKRKLFLRDIYIYLYIYFLTDREVLSANSENRKQYLTLVAEHVWGLLAPKLYTGKHCKAKQTKKKKKRMILTAQNISNIIHPRLNFMHFIISNTKKSVLLLLSCVLAYLETGWRMCVCARVWC